MKGRRLSQFAAGFAAVLLVMGLASPVAAAETTPEVNTSWALAGIAAVVVVGGVGGAAGATAGAGLAYLGCPVLGCTNNLEGNTDWMFFGSAAIFGAVLLGGASTVATVTVVKLAGVE